jgi:zinc and cadmium transporter
MQTLSILFFSLLGSVGSLAGAGVLLLFPRLHERFRALLVSYAVGTLLGACFLGLLPHAVEHVSPARVLQTTLAGLVLFFLIEKLLRLPHVHAHRAGRQPAAALILIGDALHNFVDGILIATSFFVSVPLGVVTSFAVIAHEVPQELGDFVVLLEGGMERRRAYALNFLASLTTLAGALAALWFRGAVEAFVPYVLSVAAASFLHVTMVDLSPVLHHPGTFRDAARQTGGLLIGIATILLLDEAMHR